MAITTNDSNRARLAELVNELAVVRGKVTLASRLESNFIRGHAPAPPSTTKPPR